MMEGIRLSHLASCSGASLHGGDAEVLGMAIDSREIASGSLFVAMKGERVDGHDFIDNARENGAVAAVVERLKECTQESVLPQILVEDSQCALANMARYNREKFQGSVAAITGSSGKTTCKNMLASILSQSFNICATRGNLNNELGVPLTIQRLNSENEFAVIEMGAAQQGDIAYLMNIASPTVAVVTNVTEAHIGRFGDITVTAKTKGEIYTNLSEGGTAVINRDDAFSGLWRQLVQDTQKSIRVLEYSLTDQNADIHAKNVRLSDKGIRFDVTMPCADQQQTISIELPLLGQHNVSNALAAICVACAFEVPVIDIQLGLQQVKAESGRLQLVDTGHTFTLIDDSYNANPQAMMSAIDALTDLQAASNDVSVLVLGDMAELGEKAKEKHYQVGHYAASKDINWLLAVGEYATDYVAGYQSVKDHNGTAEVVDSKDEVVDRFKERSLKIVKVLIKGSRAAQMEDVVKDLQRLSLEGEGQSIC